VLELKLPGESAHAGGGAAVADANRAAAIAAAVAAAAGQRSGGYRPNEGYHATQARLLKRPKEKGNRKKKVNRKAKFASSAPAAGGAGDGTQETSTAKPGDNLGLSEEAMEITMPVVGDWSAYDDCTRPLVVDVGCGSGQWVLRAAYEERENVGKQQRNYLGLEIREGLVRTSLIFRNQIGGLENRVTFWHGEVTDSWWTEHVATYPGPIELFCCQLPDPRLKKNVKRGGGRVLTTRRIIQPELAQAVTASLAKCGGTIYVSSDYIEVAEEMRDMLLSDKDRIQPLTPAGVESLAILPPGSGTGGGGAYVADWLPTNPFNLPTEREVRLQKSRGRKVYRLALKAVTN